MRPNRGIRVSVEVVLLFLAFFSSSIFIARPVTAATAQELRSQIDNRTAEIKRLETEIAGYQSQLAATGKEASSLQGEIRILETTRKKLAADIKVTERKIELADLEIEKITINIGQKNQSVKKRQAALAESLREWRDRDSQSLFEALLDYPHLADFWNELDRLAAWQRQVQDNIVTLRS